MKYVGKLFGQIGRKRGYFDTGKTSEDWDALEARAERAEAKLNESRYETVKAAQEGLRECIRAERAEADADSTRERALTLANSLDGAQAELAAERARLDWLQAHALAQHSESISISKLGKHYNGFPGSLRAAIDATMKEGA